MDFRKRFGKTLTSIFGRMLYIALLSITPEYARLKHYYNIITTDYAIPRFSIPMIKIKENIEKIQVIPKTRKTTHSKIPGRPTMKLPVFIITRC